MDFNVNDKVYSVYDDGVGTILKVIKTDGKDLQDFYIVKWENGKTKQVAREEIY